MQVFNKICGTLMLTTVMLTGALAQSKAKIIAVVKTADWCSLCKNHSKRALTVINKNNIDGTFHLIMNDITSQETAKKSAPEIARYGLTKAMEPYKATGVVYLFDARTKKPINQMFMALSDTDIAESMADFRSGKKYGL